MADMTALAGVTPVTDQGMILIRADLDACGDAIEGAAGIPVPGRTAIVTDGDRALGWMAPDELLLTLPHRDMPAALRDLQDALAAEHALIADVSDMRCAFDVTGPAPDQVLAKLSPTDFAAFPADGLRRSRAGQVPCAFWRVPGGFRVVAFRSVADYLAGVLRTSAAPGTWLDPR